MTQNSLKGRFRRSEMMQLKSCRNSLSLLLVSVTLYKWRFKLAKAVPLTSSTNLYIGAYSPYCNKFLSWYIIMKLNKTLKMFTKVSLSANTHTHTQLCWIVKHVMSLWIGAGYDVEEMTDRRMSQTLQPMLTIHLIIYSLCFRLLYLALCVMEWVEHTHAQTQRERKNMACSKSLNMLEWVWPNINSLK